MKHRLTSSYGMEDTNQYWEEGQLAWRLLGFYMDCNQHNSGNTVGDSSTYCKRKVMYAVYVDPDYEGNGLGEYAYYDSSSGNYKCYNNGKCLRKMNCHEESYSSSSSWQLIGVFRIDKAISENDGWMEQLFKHAGICYWGEDNYKFASEMRKILPTSCTATTSSNGNTLYYDIHPLPNAQLTIGLYKDSQCNQPYYTNNKNWNYKAFTNTNKWISYKNFSSSKLSPWNNNNIDVYSLVGTTSSDFDKFNDLLQEYTICQPCTAFYLQSQDFTCNDDAGYTNCNQCMKFAVKSESSMVTPQEIQTAYRQHTLISVTTNGTTTWQQKFHQAVSSDNVTKTFATTTARFGSLLSSAPNTFRYVLPFYLQLSLCFLLACIIFFKCTGGCNRTRVAPDNKHPTAIVNGYNRCSLLSFLILLLFLLFILVVLLLVMDLMLLQQYHPEMYNKWQQEFNISSTWP